MNSLTFNEQKTIKPCVFFGALIMFAALFVFLLAWSGLVVNYKQFTPNEFLIEFSIGAVLFIIGVVPGIRRN